MRAKFLIYSIVATFVFIVGCQATDEEEETVAAEEGQTEEGNAAEDDSFPVTVESADEPVEIQEKPEHILPLSLDVTEIVLELVEPSRVVAVTESLEDPILSTHADKADEIPNRVSSAVHIDPEEILSFDTDIMLLTKMHGQEEDANKVLSEIDLPIVTFDTMGTVEAFIDNIEIVGKAIGETEKASALIDEITSDIEDIQAKIPADEEAPSVLVLSEVGPGTGPFMMGPGNVSYDLIQKAGATPAVDEINLESSTPASIEQVLKMDPDYIFLLDFVGAGDEVFDELMENPGWDSLEAVQNDRLQVLDVKYLMNPNVQMIEGLDRMVDWIYELEE